jgi:hypothetical protein
MNTNKGKSLFDATGFLTDFRLAAVNDLESSSQKSPYHAFCYNRFLGHFDKKYLQGGNTDSRENKAYAKFLAVNQEMKELNDSYVSASTWDDEPVLRRMKHIIRLVLGPPPLLEEVFLGCKNSSGTSVGVPYRDTSPERKHRYPISGTNSAIRLWEHYKLFDTELASAVRNLNEVLGCFPETVSTRGSRACTVPKTDDIDRMISVEPTLNMYLQHGVKAIMDRCLSRVGLSLESDQELHRKLACHSSITNRYATIDFSSMSDRVSLALCHYLFPRGWYSWFWSIRSHRALLKGEYVELHMISTMGNATTFPIETLILWSLGQALDTIDRGIEFPQNHQLARDVHVFGDDCILRTELVPELFRICSLIGFVPNEDKSFYGLENFRESCGGDFFHGRDVRPLYLRSLPTGSYRKTEIEAYLYVTLNGVIRLYKKYFGTLGYIYDKSLIRFLLKHLSRVTDLVKFVPHDFPEDSGICESGDLRRWQWNYKIQVSPILINIHGQMMFSYLSFRYPDKGDVHDGIRYAQWLKRPGVLRDDSVFPNGKNHRLEINIRKKGIYVQKKAKGVPISLPTSLRSFSRPVLGRVPA